MIHTLRRKSEQRIPSLLLRYGNNARRTVEDAIDRSGRRQERLERLGRHRVEDAVNQQTNLGWVTGDRIESFPIGPMGRHDLLAGLHRALRPRSYFEIGVHRGAGLALAATRSIGVDPAPIISQPLGDDVKVYEETSDDFFARSDAFAHFEGLPVDLGFIDGMHLSEFALRDFMNLEKHMAKTGVIVFDDMLPRNSLEAYRTRRTRWWAGDVYKVTEILRKWRPDLVLLPVNTNPTGTLVVLGCDPDSRVLDDAYEELETYCITPDPQHVASEWTRRESAVDPRELLASPAWQLLLQIRDGESDPDRLPEALEQLRSLAPMR
ncbi:class I SAM-dependent methyltransferase [Aeromicrobium camelliae]|nr:class I SAM-dependent methyltransferase [Aeromicrobium camelliae]